MLQTFALEGVNQVANGAVQHFLQRQTMQGQDWLHDFVNGEFFAFDAVLFHVFDHAFTENIVCSDQPFQRALVIQHQ